jgi:hypothetical protein
MVTTQRSRNRGHGCETASYSVATSCMPGQGPGGVGGIRRVILAAARPSCCSASQFLIDIDSAPLAGFGWNSAAYGLPLHTVAQGYLIKTKSVG